MRVRDLLDPFRQERRRCPGGSGRHPVVGEGCPCERRGHDDPRRQGRGSSVPGREQCHVAASMPLDDAGGALVSQCFSSTSGEARTPNSRFRSLRRIDFATPEETTKSTVSRYRSMTLKSISSFAAVVSFAGEVSEKGTNLRNPQIQFGNLKCSPPERTDSPIDYSPIGPRFASRTSGGRLQEMRQFFVNGSSHANISHDD